MGIHLVGLAILLGLWQVPGAKAAAPRLPHLLDRHMGLQHRRAFSPHVPGMGWLPVHL